MANDLACMVTVCGVSDGTEAALSKNQEQSKGGCSTLSRLAAGSVFLKTISESLDIKALSWGAICSPANVEEGDFEGDAFSDIDLRE